MFSKPSYLLKIILTSLFFLIFINCSIAQKDSLILGREYKITLLNGFEMTEIVGSISPDTVKIETKYKTFNVPRDQIVSILDLEKVWSDDDSTLVIFDPDPNESRLFLSPTGKTLKAGHGYISTALLVPWVAVLAFPFANVGITDYLSLGVGSNIDIGIGIKPYPSLYFLAPKVRPFQFKNVNVSFGLAHVIPFDNSSSNKEYNYGILYGVSSFDIQNYTLSFGSGITYGVDWSKDKGFSVAPYPLFMFGFEARTAKDNKLISENWVSFYPDGGFVSVLSFGVRQIKGNFAFDISVLGLLTNGRFDPGGGGPRDKPYFIPVLWGSVAYNFEL
jgi:hypothetical protein